MRIYFLGTGTSQGVPVILSKDPVCLSTNPKDKRLRTSLFVEWDETIIQIDCGPDFRQQMLTSECPHIDAIVFTHEHSDHIAGLDDIRPFCFQKGGAMPIYAQKRVLQSLERRFDYVFQKENRYPGAPAVHANEIDENSTFFINSKKIEPILVMHGDLPILGYRMDRFAYLTDVKTLTQESLNKLKDLDVLVINALRIEEHPTHNNLQTALDYIRRINPKEAYITHISYQLGFHEIIEKQLPKNVYLAYDNLQLHL
ncbi:MBL fold metallo-hydrolase [Myroides ceti]|uniref:MBL fold metallo-hydrolase n=1 Tax=Paenimyroides ceti TaxID=395087 RepID=A0ABT8CQF0_9FLAO|nr:MBL fold metallo-hydrolase [Paenimyroides ceti]MDN3706728.1 MBL fold metallo-hydrolase [Paenimyroides ceti]MDN3709391.1 MBL fold metallo-hydrolase [Paenimyroides ceti]